VIVDAHDASEDNVAAMSVTLCLGEAMVDLIGEAPAASVREVERFVPHFGGATANVAVFAARAGASIALAGAAGDDRWGRWLRERLDAEGIDATQFPLLDGVGTQLAFVSVDTAGEPTYELYGELVEPLVQALGDRIDDAVDGAAGLFISSNTLAGSAERELTMRARDRALAQQRPVVFDCNLRLHRWSSRADAAASANACVPGALLVHANRDEAELLTGESEPERAALALRKAGAELVVITLGSGGALLRGDAGLRADVPAVPARVRSTIGAGDACTGTLLARLALSGFYPAAAAAALDEAVAAGAAACERWGALD
jgi:sugar/nucleoside kinase (ribokinase family)